MCNNIKLLVLLPFLFSLYPSLVISQSREDLIGTWYGKIRGYQFKQDGNARCYTKNEVINYRQKITIDKDLHYTYTETSNSENIQAKGRIILEADTISFIHDANNLAEKYFLFHLDKKQLIYSAYAVTEDSAATIRDTTAEPVFQPVESDAEYAYGRDQFFKALYSSLAGAEVQHKDSVQLNTYSIVIDNNGTPDISTLKSVSARPGYYEAIKKAFTHLPANFIPAKQNGKVVSGYFTFRFTY